LNFVFKGDIISKNKDGVKWLLKVLEKVF